MFLTLITFLLLQTPRVSATVAEVSKDTAYLEWNGYWTVAAVILIPAMGYAIYLMYKRSHTSTKYVQDNTKGGPGSVGPIS